jgi:hypothetical protein
MSAAEVLLAYAAVAAFVWLARNIGLTVLPRWVPQVRPEDADRLPPDPPKVSLVVAAKDEQHNIEACVRSLSAQDYPNLEILIVDDRSADRTPEIVENLAAGDLRLRLIRVTELPPGWFGKAHAVHTGLAAATGDWFCLTDADCVFHNPRLVSAAVARAEADGAGLLSLMPLVEMPRWWQKLTEPLNCGLLLLAFNPLKLNNPADAAGAAFAGFMLIRRSAHQAFGGHTAVASTLGEDVELGRRAKAAGCKLIVGRHDRLFTTAAYPTPAANFRGWSRVLYAALVTPGAVIAQLLLVLTLGLGPQVLAVAVGAALLAGAADLDDPPTARLSAVAAAGALLQILCTARFYRLCGAPGRYAWLYLPAAAWQFAILLHALGRFRSGSALDWRGTTYPGKTGGPG